MNTDVTKKDINNQKEIGFILKGMNYEIEVAHNFQMTSEGLLVDRVKQLIVYKENSLVFMKLF